MSWCEFIRIYLIWNLLCLPGCKFLSMIQKVWAIIILDNLSVLFCHFLLGFHYVYIHSWWCLLTLLSFFQFFFNLSLFVFSSNWTISIDLSLNTLILASAWSILLLKLSSEFFSCVVFYNFRTSIWYSLIFSAFLLKFSLHWLHWPSLWQLFSPVR